MTRRPPSALPANRRLVELEVEYVRTATVRFPMPEWGKGMGDAGWGPQAVNEAMRTLHVRAWGERRSMDEVAKLLRWRVVELCSPDNQYGEHGEWEPVPPFESVTRCTRCGMEVGK